MEINRLAVTYGGTVNVGDYSNVKIEVTVEATLDAGEDFHGAKERLMDKAQTAYIDEVAQYAQENYTALNYMRVIAPGRAAEITEQRNAKAAQEKAEWLARIAAQKASNEDDKDLPL